jgi:hypothetical protein
MRAMQMITEIRPMRPPEEWALPEYDRRRTADRRRGDRRAAPAEVTAFPSPAESSSFSPPHHGPHRRPSCGTCRFAHPSGAGESAVRLCTIAPDAGRLVIIDQARCEAFQASTPAVGG